MKHLDTEILVIGSGLVGVVATYALSLLKFKIILIDQKKIFFKNPTNANIFNADSRTTAVAEGSKDFLDKIGLWKNLSRYAEPIKNIKVIDRLPINKIEFLNFKKNSNLGYIIKNTLFKNVVLKKLSKKTNVTLLGENTLEDIKYSNSKIISKFNKCIIDSKLLIAADGKNSKTRNIIKTPLYKKTYKESALVVNFEHSKTHNNLAYEFFYKNGPLAILPMKKEKEFQSSMIWSNNKEFLCSLIKTDEDIFSEIIERKISNYLGKVIKIKSKQLFPLSAHLNAQFYGKKIIYIGDSAHSIHPIAGQGWNIGLRDVKNLYNLTLDFNKMGLSIFDTNFYKSYNQNSYYDAFRMFQVTDLLNTIFKNDYKTISGLRSIGFKFIEKRKGIKKQIADFAMGF